MPISVILETMTEAFDALVIGGGPGGATTALLLAKAGWSVALLERKAFPRRKVCGEYLSATSLPLLTRLGIAAEFLERAGPHVRRVGLYAGPTILAAELPRSPGRECSGSAWGHALGREHLDTLLLRRAAAEGVAVFQPCSIQGLARAGAVWRCRADAGESSGVPIWEGEAPAEPSSPARREPRPPKTGYDRKSWAAVDIEAPVVVAAHGSWETGPLPTQPAQRVARPADLLGFKAHFLSTDLPSDLMPLLAFPGGYGGMAHSDDGRVSLSCCIRRDQLAALRHGTHGQAAGEVVLDHILHHCLGARRALAGALRQGDWLSAGPLRPGIRLPGPPGIFPVGNCAGEAHPVIAEGISMAMQSAWLLVRCLDGWRTESGRVEALPTVGRLYARKWRKAFAPRLYAAAAVAHWAMRPAAVAGSLPLLRCFPGLLTWGARLSGKATRIVRPMKERSS
jgi:2-polyprenyl-6-methoxyphenol hydroxylase-like FAD-dependent oxidoreductase